MTAETLKSERSTMIDRDDPKFQSSHKSLFSPLGIRLSEPIAEVRWRHPFPASSIRPWPVEYSRKKWEKLENSVHNIYGGGHFIIIFLTDPLIPSFHVLLIGNRIFYLLISFDQECFERFHVWKGSIFISHCFFLFIRWYWPILLSCRWPISESVELSIVVSLKITRVIFKWLIQIYSMLFWKIIRVIYNF